MHEAGVDQRRSRAQQLPVAAPAVPPSSRSISSAPVSGAGFRRARASFARQARPPLRGGARVRADALAAARTAAGQSRGGTPLVARRGRLPARGSAARLRALAAHRHATRASLRRSRSRSSGRVCRGFARRDAPREALAVLLARSPSGAIGRSPRRRFSFARLEAGCGARRGGHVGPRARCSTSAASCPSRSPRAARTPVAPALVLEASRGSRAARSSRRRWTDRPALVVGGSPPARPGVDVSAIVCIDAMRSRDSTVGSCCSIPTRCRLGSAGRRRRVAGGARVGPRKLLDGLHRRPDGRVARDARRRSAPRFGRGCRSWSVPPQLAATRSAAVTSCGSPRPSASRAELRGALGGFVELTAVLGVLDRVDALAECDHEAFEARERVVVEEQGSDRCVGVVFHASRIGRRPRPSV